jgi:hypothetical protein
MLPSLILTCSLLKVGRLLTDYTALHARTLHNSMIYDLPRKFDSCSSGQEILCLLLNPKVHYRVDKRPLLVPILSQMNLAYTLCSFKIHFNNIILLSTSKYSLKRTKYIEHIIKRD